MIIHRTSLAINGIFTGAFKSSRGEIFAFAIAPDEDWTARITEARANAERLLGEPAPDIPAPYISKEMRDLYAQRQTESDMSFFI